MQLNRPPQPTIPADDRRLLARKIASCQTIWTSVWHGQSSETPADPLMALVQEQHRRNFDLWHEEDKARAPHASDTEIAQVKRNIDRFNQQRNDLIEKVDDFLAQELQAASVQCAADAPWNSETPGSIVDKLSILSLKIYHMREQTERSDATVEHIKKCRQRLQVLTQQHEDMIISLERLTDDLFGGRKQMKLYRQFKMYNDPDSNPAIYGSRKPG